MGLSDLTDAEAVHKAVAEYDELGRDRFLAKYGFRKSRSFWLRLNGKLYVSKAVVAAAHAYQHGKPLSFDDFSGGAATVQPVLERLGFEVVNITEAEGSTGTPQTSSVLHEGQVYSRADLMEMFAIKDSTINTGVFRPKGTNSVWLFVTAKKPNDRTQYEDRLEGERLYWQGQTSGRTDKLIMEHAAEGLEVLLFYRKEKYEHPKAAFRYHGPFRYVSSSGANPRDFVLEKVNPAGAESSGLDEAEGFDPTSIEDGRKKTMASIHRRQGQGAFRAAVLTAYSRRCAVTGCPVEAVLEAAHIVPYRGPATNHVSNGLLLRADLHTLFDLGLIAVDTSSMAIMTAPSLAGTEYAKLAGQKIGLPSSSGQHPSKEALDIHRLEVFQGGAVEPA